MISDALRARMKKLCDIMQDVSGIDPTIQSRKQDVVAVRMMVIIQLLNEGNPSVRVAELFNKDHSTIAFYKRRMESIRFPGWEAELEIWNKFQEKIKKETP